MGNTLNAGTGKGNAVGFKLSALLKLSDLKSTDKGDKKSTLLHFVVEVVRSNAPRIRKVTELLPIVRDAARVSLEDLEAKRREASAGLEHVDNEVCLGRG